MLMPISRLDRASTAWSLGLSPALSVFVVFIFSSFHYSSPSWPGFFRSVWEFFFATDWLSLPLTIPPPAGRDFSGSPEKFFVTWLSRLSQFLPQLVADFPAENKKIWDHVSLLKRKRLRFIKKFCSRPEKSHLAGGGIVEDARPTTKRKRWWQIWM